MKTFIKKKAGPSLGFRTPDYFKGRTFSGMAKGTTPRFDPSRFKTQHKG